MWLQYSKSSTLIKQFIQPGFISSSLELQRHVTMLKSQYRKEIEQPVSINSPLFSIYRTCSVQAAITNANADVLQLN